MADYDKYYKTEELFGEPYPDLIEFFQEYDPKGKIIDLGCGQGRDVIPIARLGYSVTGIDNSRVGIKEMMTRAKSEGLDVTAIIGDIYKFKKYQEYDIVLLDSMFHFDKNDRESEIELINKILNNILIDSIICFCIQDTGNKVEILKQTIENSSYKFEILKDSSLNYIYEDKKTGHTSETKYCMYIVRKRKTNA